MTAPSLQAADVTTQHNDNGRTGANLSEPVLNTTNVNVNTFGKLFSRTVDGHIYAQLLYVSNLSIPGQGVHNVVYVCTQHDSVFAFDADNPSASTPLWQVSLGTSVPIAVLGSPDQENIYIEVGITSTPVIDPTSNTLYVVAETYENNQVIFRLHALDITTGSERSGSPVVIQGSVAGTAPDAANGLLTFQAFEQLQRPGLLLLNGNVYISFGSHGDDAIWHGWLFGYSATTLQQTGVFCTSPNSDSSGIWLSGVGPAADSAGNIFLATGNGLLDVYSGGSDYGDSVLKLSTAGGLNAVDYFAPSDQQSMDAADTDLGSGGTVIIPGTSFAVHSGKDGVVYLLDRNNLGQFNSASNNVLQNWPVGNGAWGGGVFYNSTFYNWGVNQPLSAYSFNGTTFNTTASSQSSFSPSGDFNSPAMSLSANGTVPGTAILWATHGTSTNPERGSPMPGILHALDASNVSKELWNSNQNASRDSSGSWAKFNAPTIANGKVYLGTFDGILNVYGLLAPPGSPASVAVAGGAPQSATLGTVFVTPLQAVVMDSNHNLLKGVSVTFTAPANGSSAAFGGSATVTVSTQPNGVATAPALTANAQAGAYLVTATVSGVGTGANFSLTNTTAAGITASAGTPQSATVKTAFSTALQAIVKDSLNNPVSGVTVTFTAPSSGASGLFGSSLTATAVTLASGVATAPVLTANEASGTFTVTATVSGVATPANFSLTSTPSAPVSLAVSGGTPQTTPVNTAFTASLRATVRDSHHNPVSGVTVTFTSPGSGASATFGGLATVAVVTNASGVAISPVPVANGVVGTYNVSATAPGLTAVSFALTNNPVVTGATTSVKMDTTTQGNWKSVYGGNGYNVIGDSASNPSYVTPTPSGQSTATWAASTSDPRALQKATNPADRIAAAWFSPSQFTIDMNFSDTATHQVALYFLDWDNQARRQTVAVVDANGTVLNTQPLTSSFYGGVYLVWNVSGHVQFLFTLYSGPNAVVSGLFFDGSQNAPSITASAGTPQSTVVSTSFGKALQATVKDASGNPVNGASVKFTAPSSGASATFSGSATATVSTNASGVAISPVPVANTAAGTYTVTATTAALSANFSLTNTAGPPSSVTASGGTPQSTVVSTAFGTALQATVKDGSGNPVSGVTVTFTAPGSGASATFGGSATVAVATNASGIASSPIPVANSVAGSYNVSASAPGLTAVTFALTNTAGTASPGTATFVKTDTTTQGSWKSVYGANGYNVIGDSATNPSYVTPVPSGQTTTTWAASTSDSRALQKATNPADRIAATWFSATQFTIDMNISDTATHQVALYLLDWDSTARREKIDVLNASGTVLNTQALTSSFNGGVYLVWNVSGHVTFRITWNAGANAVVSGLFFDTPGPASIAASAGTPQTTVVSTSFGAALQATVKDGSGNPVSGVTVTFTAPGSGASATFGGSATAAVATNASGIAFSPVPVANSVAGSYNVSASVPGLTAATFALTNTAGAAASVTASAGTPQSTVVSTSFGAGLQATVKDGSGNPVSGVTVTFTAPGSGASATFGGSATVGVMTNASGTASSPIPVANSVAGSYNVSASAPGLTAVTFALTNTAGTSSPGTATFVKTDTPTQGSWKSVYGNDGYNVIGDSATNPSYVTPVPSGQTTTTWAASTSDPRALQKASNPADRIAACWHSAVPFTIDMNISDTATHQVALYFLDWDSTARRQTVDVLNANGTVLNTQALTSSFNGGVYLVWNVSGHVQFRITLNAGTNAVVSGLFFDVPQPASATFVTMDTTTQGNWKSAYGADGYNVILDGASNPSYVTPVASGQSSYTWATSTSDPRALQKASNPADRIAATWFSNTPFTIDMNISDAATHQVALYFLDWDSTARRETVTVLDANGTVLNTQALTSSFNGGVYLVWNVNGHVTFRITLNAGPNAVISGLFFEP